MTETKEKYVRKIRKNGVVEFLNPVFIRQEEKVLYLSYKNRDNFTKSLYVHLPTDWEYVTFEETEDKGIFIARESTETEIINKYSYHKSDERVMNASAYVTRERHLRFQLKDLQPLMSQSIKGYFYMHLVRNQKEYIEISFYPHKKLRTFQEEAIRKYGSVLEMGNHSEIDITFRVNPVGAGATFAVPHIFLGGIEKGTCLPYHYEDNKIVVEKPTQRCSCCGKEISSYYDFKETVSVCRKCSETLDMISERTFSYCRTTRDAMKDIIENYREIIENNESIKAKLTEANKKLNAVLGGKME